MNLDGSYVTQFDPTRSGLEQRLRRRLLPLYLQRPVKPGQELGRGSRRLGIYSRRWGACPSVSRLNLSSHHPLVRRNRRRIDVETAVLFPLAAWESFYVIVGSSGAALTGL